MLRAQLRLWLSIYDPPHRSGGDDASCASKRKEEEMAMVAKHYWIWWPGEGRDLPLPRGVRAGSWQRIMQALV